MTLRLFTFTGLFTLLLATSVGAFRPIAVNELNVAIRGYDPVAYFTEGQPVRGSELLPVEWNGAIWQFSKGSHRRAFLADPAKYAPQYGGHCALCISVGNTTPFDPEAFVIRDDRLYLFQSKEVRDLWLESPEARIAAGAQTYTDYVQHVTSGSGAVRMNELLPRVLFVITSHAVLGDTGEPTGAFLSEITHPHKVLRDAGFFVNFVSPEGGPAPIDPKSHDLSDPVNRAFLENDRYAFQLANTLTPDLVKTGDYVGIFYAGGHGTMYDLADNEALQALTREIYEDGGVVGAVCHGPVGLVNVTLSDGSYLVDGKRVAAFTNEEEEAVGLTEVMPFLLEDVLVERGATMVEAPNFQKSVAVDGRLVTGQNPASATGVGEAMREALRERLDQLNARTTKINP